jgi:predicted nucleic acid-binding protein
MYVAGTPHPLREPALRFLRRAQSGEFEACTSTEVLQEILYRYASLKRLDYGRQVYDLFVQLCHIIFPVGLADTDMAKDIVCADPGVGVRDAIHAAVMMNNEIMQLASFDAGFDRIEGIERILLQ